MQEHGLMTPHGGTLCEGLAGPDRLEELKREVVRLPSIDLGPRALCDLELLLNGGFSPLQGFLAREDYESVVERMRLANGVLWPIPVVLDVPESVANGLTRGERVALRDPEGQALAVMTVSDVWEADRSREAERVYGTRDRSHPGVDYLLAAMRSHYVGGTLEGLHLPIHYDFPALRQTPAELRRHFAAHGWTRVVAFQTRNPLHRAHFEMTLRAAREIDGHVLLHPSVGMTKPGDIDHYSRVRCYAALAHRYPPERMLLRLLPLAMRMAGPREAVWHAIIRKNYGCTHFIVGRDHAGPGSDGNGRPFYGSYDAQELVHAHRDDLGISMVPFRQMEYRPDLDAYMPEDEVPPGAATLSISGTELRRYLLDGGEIPAWFSFPEVVEELRRVQPPRARQGFTVFFTGLSGSGKSTIANVLMVRLLELGGRRVTLLDGDIVRKHLSSELGFSKEHRDLNVQRIGFVASEITKHGGVAICAPIAPYEAVRNANRRLIDQVGGYVEVHVATPIDVCEQRDRKGLYAKARAGLLKGFTGIDDPYEEPRNPEMRLETTTQSPEESAQVILDYLAAEGYIPATRSADQGEWSNGGPRVQPSWAVGRH